MVQLILLLYIYKELRGLNLSLVSGGEGRCNLYLFISIHYYTHVLLIAQFPFNLFTEYFIGRLFVKLHTSLHLGAFWWFNKRPLL